MLMPQGIGITRTERAAPLTMAASTRWTCGPDTDTGARRRQEGVRNGGCGPLLYSWDQVGITHGFYRMERRNWR